MTDYEYALRTVTVASGQAFEIAHAVGPGTLVALCGTVAVPAPGSRWDDSDPNARCAACERAIGSLNKPVPEPEPELPTVVEPVAAEAADAVDRPAPLDVLRDGFGSALAGWQRVSRPVRLGLAGVLLAIVVAVVVVLITTGGFHADQNSPSYKNGYAYGHDLMNHSNDVAGSCTQATVDEPTTPDGKNFIAGCEAGYAARTP